MTEKTFESLLEDIAENMADQGELQEIIAEKTTNHTDAIDAARKEIAAAEERIQAIEAERRELCEEEYEEALELDADLKRLKTEFKTLAKSSPPSELKDTRYFENDTLKVTISRTSTVITYDTVGLLERLPALMNLSVKGEHVIVPEVNVGLMERLLLLGDVDDSVREFRTEMPGKAPSVSFKVKEG